MLARGSANSQKRSEWLLFFLLAVVIWLFITVGVVAGWGFLVWMYYMFTRPPGSTLGVRVKAGDARWPMLSARQPLSS